MSHLTFAALRAANCARLPLFKNAKGEIVHNHDGSDWSLSQWTTAVLGELGELANLIKKIERKDFALDDTLTDPKTKEVMTYRAYVGKEAADVACYLDILSYRLGVDLGDAIREKFNEVSRRVKAPIFIEHDGTVVQMYAWHQDTLYSPTVTP